MGKRLTRKNRSKKTRKMRRRKTRRKQTIRRGGTSSIHHNRVNVGPAPDGMPNLEWQTYKGKQYMVMDKLPSRGSPNPNEELFEFIVIDNNHWIKVSDINNNNSQ